MTIIFTQLLICPLSVAVLITLRRTQRCRGTEAIHAPTQRLTSGLLRPAVFTVQNVATNSNGLPMAPLYIHNLSRLLFCCKLWK